MTATDPQTMLQKDGKRKHDTLHESLLSNMDLPLRHTFYPLGFALEIITNEPHVIRAAGDSFGHRRLRRGHSPLQIRIGVSEGGGSKCPPEPTRREYNHLYSLVADNDNQALLDLKTCTSFMWLNRSALKNPLYFRYNFLEKVVYLLLGASVVTDLHAACVSKNGRGILLCGDSGAGKSTLAYGCARAGWTYTSDDTSYLINASDVPRVIGHSHRVRFRPTAQSLFPELERFDITPRMEGKPSIEVSVSELPALQTAPETNIHSIVYLQRQPSTRAKLIPLPSGTATQRTRQDLFSAGEIRVMHEKILERLSTVPTYELHYCDMQDAIAALDLLTLEM